MKYDLRSFWPCRAATHKPTSADTSPMAMKISEVHEFIKKTAHWNNWSQTVDGFLWGDPDQDLTGIAVCWCSKKPQIEEALENACNMYITHEPLYSYVHNIQYEHPLEAEKTKVLRDSRIVVYRCHDVLDMFPEIGIPDSWARVLGFEDPPASSRPASSRADPGSWRRPDARPR